MLQIETKASTNRELYALLDLDASATSVDIQTAFERLSLDIDLHHAQEHVRMQSAEKLLAITEAYEILSDPIRRSQYDIKLYGRRNLPGNTRVDNLFREGVKAYRAHKTDLALRYFKEIVNLFPHRSLYRVHLAIAYADKNWMAFTESELQTALRLDTEDQFAKESVAKLLFKLPDKTLFLFGNRMYRQVALISTGLIVLSVVIIAGVPQRLMANVMAKISSAEKSVNQTLRNRQEKENPDAELEEQLPDDLKQELKNKKDTTSEVKIPKLADDYALTGHVYDYTKQIPKQKTYYPDQQVVVVAFEDGSILTYRPAELKGWREDPQSKQVVVVTKDNEIIPSPADLPLLMPNQTPFDRSAPDFPKHLFPEYGQTGETGDSVTVPAPQTTVIPNSDAATTAPGTASPTPPPAGSVPAAPPQAGLKAL